MYYEKVAGALLYPRWPSSLFRVNDGILLPVRMAAAALHCLAFVVCVEDHGALALASVNQTWAIDTYEGLRHEVRSSLAFTFMFLVLTSFIFLTGVLIRWEALHFCQAMLHVGGSALLLAVWRYRLHVDRVWHSALVFNLMPLCIDVLAMLYVWRRKMLWIW